MYVVGTETTTYDSNEYPQQTFLESILMSTPQHVFMEK